MNLKWNEATSFMVFIGILNDTHFNLQSNCNHFMSFVSSQSSSLSGKNKHFLLMNINSFRHFIELAVFLEIQYY